MTKEQKTTTIIIIASILFVALVAFILWRMYEKKQTTSDMEQSSIFPLKIGSRGEEVKVLQRHLNNKMANMKTVDGSDLVPLDVDGIFGEKTQLACVLVFGTETVSAKQFSAI